MTEAEGHTTGRVIASCREDPARSENPGMHGIFMRENREVPHLPAWVITGRAAQGTLRRYV